VDLYATAQLVATLLPANASSGGFYPDKAQCLLKKANKFKVVYLKFLASILHIRSAAEGGTKYDECRPNS
jgi:hypothetical protein